MVKTRHSLSCLTKPPGRNSVPRLHSEVSCGNYGNGGEIPKKPLPIALVIIETTSASWSGEKRVHP